MASTPAPQLWDFFGEPCAGCLKKTCPLHGADRVILVVECDPSWGRNNTRYADRHSKRLSDAFVSFIEYVWVAWREVGSPVFHEGSIGVEFCAYWDRQRHLDFPTGIGDVDAIDKAVLDGLGGGKPLKRNGRLINKAKLLDDDDRVEHLVCRKDYDKGHPRVEIGVWRRP